MTYDNELVGKVTAKSCPDCGPTYRMIIRQNSKTGKLFLGCINYPECKRTELLPESFKMKAMGQRGLFDDEL